MQIRVTLEYNGILYSFVDEYISFPDFIWEEGNYSCDCNRSDFIKIYCNEYFPGLPCGDSIKLIDISLALQQMW